MPFNSKTEMVNYWNHEAKKKLEGKKIIKAQYQEDEELGYVFAIYLDDGSCFFVMADDECNAAGSLCFADESRLPTVR